MRLIFLSVALGGLIAVAGCGGAENVARTSANNLKRIGLAFVNYADSEGRGFPTDIVSKDGKPLLSWRVAILPFVENESLYKQFKLDEPWDSEHNKALLDKIPRVYAPVLNKSMIGGTHYQTFTGPGALFGDKSRGPWGVKLPDGRDRTALVFEGADPVPWTKPADLPFDANKPLPKLGGLFEGGFHVVLGDASVHFIRSGADEQQLKNLIMPADGNDVDWSKLGK